MYTYNWIHQPACDRTYICPTSTPLWIRNASHGYVYSICLPCSWKSLTARTAVICMSLIVLNLVLNYFKPAPSTTYWVCSYCEGCSTLAASVSNLSWLHILCHYKTNSTIGVVIKTQFIVPALPVHIVLRFCASKSLLSCAYDSAIGTMFK